MKTRMKRLISLVCVLTVFASTVLSTDFLSAKAETNSGQVETLPTDMTEITFLDFELKGPNYSGVFKDGEYTKWSYAKYAGETMDNTLFSGTVTFPEEVDVFFMYAGNAIAEGIQLVTAQEKTGEWYLRLRNSETKKDLKKITAQEAGVETLVGVPLDLHISLEYIDNDNGGTENDVKLGVWFGDTLYMNEYTYINDCVGSAKIIGPYLAFQPKKTAGITMKSYTPPLPTDMTEITFMDFGIEDDKYKSTFAGTYAGETMDNTLFSGKITFSETGSTNLMYGGTSAGGGFILQDTVDLKGNPCLRLWDSDRDNKKFEDQRFYADKAGVDTFEGKELELTYTLEYVNNDNGTTKNDLKLGVWFNKRLYENKYIYINNYVDNGHSIGNYMTVWVQGGAEVKLKSCNYQLPEDMTEISFRDFVLKGPNYSGTFKDGEYTKWSYAQYAGETMDNTLFSGKITFPTEANVFFMYAGNTLAEGIQLITAQDATTGEWYLRLRNSETKKDLKKFIAEEAGVKALVGVPLELHISLEYIDNDGEGTENDVKLGVWFGDTLYMDEYTYINNCVGSAKIIGPYLTFQPTKTAGITMKSSDFKLPTGMQHLSFRDFGFADGTLTAKTNKGEYEGNTLNNTLFRGNITYSTVGTSHLAYGGKGSLQGFLLANVKDAATGEHYLRLWDSNADKSGQKFSDIKFYSDVAGVQLVGAKLDLALSMEYVNNDNGQSANDLKLGVWFGGKLYNNTYIYINNYVDTGHSVGQFMTIWNQEQGATVAVESVGEINWKPMPEGMTEITFRDFRLDGPHYTGAFADSTYTKWSGAKYSGETMNNTLFGGIITFPKVVGAQLSYGGKATASGLELVVAQDSTTNEWYLRLRENKNKAFKEINLYPNIAGVEFVGVPLELNISLEYVNNDGGTTNNDVKLGVWFGGKLYGNQYIYINNFVDAENAIGPWLTFAPKTDGPITMESIGEINWEPMPEGMTEITFRDFQLQGPHYEGGFRDGTYTKWSGAKYTGKTMNNTLFGGTITFPKVVGAQLSYGGKETSTGLELVVAQDSTTNEWYLRLRESKNKAFNEQKLYSDIAGVELVGVPLELNISLEYVNNDGGATSNDVKLGVWFGGKLYGNQYLYINNFVDAENAIGPWLTFIPKTNGPITMKSVEEIYQEPLPTGLTQIGFSDFGIKSGVYEGGATGTYEGESLKNTLFSGIVKWNPEVGETHLVYGGVGGSHGAINLVNAVDAKTGELCLRMYYTTPKNDGGKKYTNHYFYSDVANVTLIGEELDLKISLEYVDNDDDAKENDLKIGLWFDGKLYNNRYIYIDNFEETGHVLSNKIQIVNRLGSAFNVGSISDWLDWSVFGLTSNWKKTLLDTDFNLTYTLAGGNPYTGDNTTFPYLLMSASLIAIVLCGCQIIRKEREEHERC